MKTKILFTILLFTLLPATQAADPLADLFNAAVVPASPNNASTTTSTTSSTTSSTTPTTSSTTSSTTPTTSSTTSSTTGIVSGSNAVDLSNDPFFNAADALTTATNTTTTTTTKVTTPTTSSATPKNSFVNSIKPLDTFDFNSAFTENTGNTLPPAENPIIAINTKTSNFSPPKENGTEILHSAPITQTPQSGPEQILFLGLSLFVSALFLWKRQQKTTV